MTTSKITVLFATYSCLVLTACSSLTAGEVRDFLSDAHPGWSGRKEADAIWTVVGNRFDSSAKALSFLGRATSWKADAPSLEVGEPSFTVVDYHWPQFTYQYSYVKATVPVSVPKEAQVGRHAYKVTVFDAAGLPMIEVSGSVSVESKGRVNLTNGATALIFGGALIISALFWWDPGSHWRSASARLGASLCGLAGVIIFLQGLRLLLGALFAP